MRMSAVFILFVVACFIFSAAVFLVSNAVAGENNLDLLTGVMHPCQPFTIRKSDRMIIIRIDDIQSYAFEDISLRMMDMARERHIPLSLGVIPKGIDESQTMYTYLRSNRCNIEIALHGWDHNGVIEAESPEFRGLSKEEAYARIMKGKQALERLAREKITTFIPPNNEMSEGTIEARNNAGIPAVSSEGNGYFDYGAETFDFDTDSINSVETVIADCEKVFERQHLCVIMSHPQDYMTGGAVDEVKFAAYPQLLDELQTRGYTFVRIKDLVDFDRTYRSWTSFLFPISPLGNE